MSNGVHRPVNYCSDHERVAEVVAQWVAYHQLFLGVKRLGLAVSGGADSVALFHLLLPLCRAHGIEVFVLHLNHGLRPEALEEARFVQSLAQGVGVECRCGKSAVARRPTDGRSLEMAARDARLAFMNECAAALRLDAIATGHQADDVAEGLLLRLARGAGASGLAALRPVSPLPRVASGSADGELLAVSRATNFIRPLLTIAGAALRGWLKGNSLIWYEDATNRDLTIPRNLVRHALLPQIEKIWPVNIRARLCQSADILREDEGLLNELALGELERLTATIGSRERLLVVGLLGLAPALQRRVIRLWMFEQGVARAAGLNPVQTLLDCCQLEGNWQRTLPGVTVIRCRGGELTVVRPQAAPPAAVELVVPTTEPLLWGDVSIETKQACGINPLSYGVGCYPAQCSLNAVVAQKGITVRSRQAGDRIAPTGMEGTKKIQELFIDAKIPEALRDHIPVFVCVGEVVWVPGYRISRNFAVPSATAPSVTIEVAVVDGERNNRG